MTRKQAALLLSGVLTAGGPLAGALVTALLLRSGFQDVGQLRPSEKSAALSEAISKAMVPTAIGLGVGVVALVATIVLAVQVIRERRASTAKERTAGAPLTPR